MSVTPASIEGLTTPGGSDTPFTSGLKSLGKDDFLHLLIAKLENQDPLNPMQDEDFVAQLAQFSSLEQMANIAQGISEANEWDYLQMQSINNIMAAGLIGKEVQANFSGLYFDGNTPPTISVNTDRFAQTLEITIKNSSGHVVATLQEGDVTAGTHTFEWDGRDLQSNLVEAGRYTIDVVGTDRDGNTFTVDQSFSGLVEAVTYRDGSAYFQVNGMEIPFGDVRAIIDPEDEP